MLRYATLLLSILFIAQLTAQPIATNSAVGEYYRITDAEARLMLVKNAPFDSTWLHTLVGTNDTVNWYKLPPAHYLFVMAREENITAEVSVVHAFEFALLNSRRELAFVLTDPSGHRITDAVATLDGKRVPFNKKMQCYRLPKRKKGGILEISALGHTEFYNIEKHGSPSIRRQRWERFTAKPLGRIVAVPWYQLRRTVWLARHPRYWKRYDWFQPFRRRHDYNDQAFGGYVAFSQPKYRPGDTLQMKAWVVSPKNKPWKRPLHLAISEQNQHRHLREVTLSPTEPGVFQYSTVMNDSLLIDRGYTFRLEEQMPERKPWQIFRKKRSPYAMYQSVYYEDYVLDEANWAFSQKKSTYYKGDSLVFTLTAKDPNGHAMPDGYYTLVVKTTAAHEFYAPEVQLPDTLWRTEGAMDPSGEMQLVVPDELLPWARVGLQADVYCTNGAGELQQKTLRLTVDKKRPRFIVNLSKGWLTIDWDEPETKPKKVLLYANRMQLPGTPDTVALPYRVRIQPEVTVYSAVSGADFIQVYPTNNHSTPYGISSKINRQTDSLVFTLENPHRIPVYYRLMQDQKQYLIGCTSDSVWTFTTTANHHDYYAYYSFLWGGTVELLEDESKYIDKLLAVDIEQPADVAPGAPVQVKIKVTNQHKRPRKGVNLTSGAYNSLFGAPAPYGTPEIIARRRKSPLVYPEFTATPLDEKRYILPNSEKWYTRLRLDQLPFYQLRHRTGANPFYVVETDTRSVIKTLPQAQPEHQLPGLPSATDSFYYNRPQFAPFVVKDFATEPIYLIWLNDRLIYYYGHTDAQPYSFYGQYGRNNIRIRTKNRLYTLEGVQFEKGKKYTIAMQSPDNERRVIDLRDSKPMMGTALGATVFTQESRPDTFTVQEKLAVRQNMLLLRPSPFKAPRFFWNSADNVHIVSDNRSPFHIIGPFDQFYPVHAAYKDHWLTQFTFDPGFEYDIYAQRERLYSTQWPGSGKLPPQLPLQPMNDWAVGPHLIALSSPLPAPIHTFRGTGTDSPGKGVLQYSYSVKDIVIQAIALRRDTTWMGPWNSTQVNGLQPGQYTLFLFSTNGSLLKKDIEIRPDTLLYLNLSSIPLQKCLPDEQFNRLFPPAVPVPSISDNEDYQISTRPMPLGWVGDCIIEGNLKDESGEALIGAAIQLMQNGVLIRGVVTDVDGNFRLDMPAGQYDIIANYTGYGSTSIRGAKIVRGKINTIAIVMHESSMLQEVLITGYAAGVRISSNLTSSTTRYCPPVIISDKKKESITLALPEPEVAKPAAGAGPEEEVAVRSKFRDYAYWKPNLRTDANGEAYFTAVFPDNITSWNSFAIAADRKGRAGVGVARTRTYKNLTAQLAVPRFAVAGDQFDISGRVTNRAGDSVSVKTRFFLNKNLLREKDSRLLHGLVEKTAVTVPNTTDTLSVTYEMRSGSVSDGEMRKIPVVPQGTLETTGEYRALYSDTTLFLRFDPAFGPVSIRVENSPMELVLTDIEYLRNYPYGCNEQTSSRLIALLLLKKINTQQHKTFLYEKDIQACLQRLKKAQKTDGSWGWWPQGPTNTWMTIYVSRALSKANQMGYDTPGLNEAFSLLNLLLPDMNRADQRSALALIKERNPHFDCKPYLDRFEKQVNRNISEAFDWMQIRLICGETIAKDSLEMYLKHTTMGGIYCGDNGYDWYNRRTSCTWQAYDIATRSGWKDIIRGIETYWLQDRQSSRNTIETAQILEALVPGLLGSDGTIQPARISINGMSTDTFPVVRIIQPDAQKPLQIIKTGSTPVYVTAYQRWQNSAPAPKVDIFEITSQLLSLNGTPLSALQYGEKAILEVHVKAKSTANYVMIEVPIPASCTYGEKAQQFRWQGPEVHREYFKDRTSIFCERLETGDYTFRIELEPRFTGTFTLNPARAEQMYFPVFYGRNEVKKVQVRPEF